MAPFLPFFSFLLLLLPNKKSIAAAGADREGAVVEDASAAGPDVELLPVLLPLRLALGDLVADPAEK